MQIQEINNKKWKVAKNLEINTIRAYGFEKIEQEFHINIIAEGYEIPKEAEAHICCSIQKYINKLSTNPSFKLTKVLKSIGLQQGNDRILQITGIINNVSLISIRNQRKKTNLTEEQRQIIRNRLEEMRKRKKIS